MDQSSDTYLPLTEPTDQYTMIHALYTVIHAIQNTFPCELRQNLEGPIAP